MIKTNNILDNETINMLASNKNSEDIEEFNNESDESEEESDNDEESEEESEDDELDNYEISSRMIINKRNKLDNVYKEAENASVNAHKLRNEAIELAKELEDYESLKTEMN